MRFIFTVFAFVFMIASNTYAENVYLDMAGRKVSVPKDVKRIVAISGALRLVVYLDRIDKVVGVEAIEKRMGVSAMRPYSLIINDTLNSLPYIGEGGAGRLPDFERLIGIGPQLIITADPNISTAELIQNKTKIPVLVVNYGDIGMLDVERINGSIRLLGKVLNRQKRAEDLVALIDKTIVDLKKRTSNIRQRKGAYVGGLGYKGAHGIGSTQGAYPPFEWVNVRNVAHIEGRMGAFFIDREQLLRWDPEYIFIDSGGLNIIKESGKDRHLLTELKAIKNKKTFITLPFNNYYTNIEYALSNGYFIGKTIYPERFKDIDILKKTDEITKFMLGRSVIEIIKRDTLAFKQYEID